MKKGLGGEEKDKEGLSFRTRSEIKKRRYINSKPRREQQGIG